MYTLALNAFLAHEDNQESQIFHRYHNIVYEYCNAVDVESSELFNRSRMEHYVRIRSLFCYWCDLSISELASLLKMHHSSILHYKASHFDRLSYDKQYQKLYTKLYF